MLFNFEEDDDELFTSTIEKQKYSNEKLFSQAMIALVLVFMEQPFDHVTADKIEGSSPFNATCNELIVEMKLRKKEDALTNKEDSEWIEEINLHIVVLLSVIFSKLFYRVQDNEQGFAATMEAKILFDRLLSEHSNTKIYAKITGLYGLIGKTPAQVEQTLIKDFYSNMHIFTTIMNLPFVEKTMNDLIKLLHQGQRIHCSIVFELLKNNKAKIAGRNLMKSAA